MARKKIPDADRSRVVHKVRTREGSVHYVESFSQLDTLKHIYQPDIHALKATEAVELWRAGVKIESAIPAPDPAQTDLALDGASGPQSDQPPETEKTTAGPANVDPAPPQAVTEPEAPPARNKGMFARRAG